MRKALAAKWRGKILHARLTLGGRMPMASDCAPDKYYQPKGFSVSLITSDSAEAERLFQALAEGRKVEMPIQKNALGHAFRHAGRSVRHTVDDRLRDERLRALIPWRNERGPQ
jgi:uncharacterized glyoxalase superfamily protein PhnB